MQTLRITKFQEYQFSLLFFYIFLPETISNADTSENRALVCVDIKMFGKF